MKRSNDNPNCVNRIGTFQRSDALHGRTSVRYWPSQTVIQQLHHLESKFANLQVCSVNVGTLRGRSEKTVEILCQVCQ